MINSNRGGQLSKIFCHEMVARVAQRGCRVAIHANFQILSGYDLGQPAVGDPI